MALHPICPVILYSELTLNRPLRRPELIPATSSPPFRGSFVQLRSLPGTRLGRSLGSYNRAKYVDKNRETRPIKGKLDETSKVSLRFPFFAWIQGELRERERTLYGEGWRGGRWSEKTSSREVGSEIGRESWCGRGGRGASGSAEERIEIFGEEMETFPNGSRFLFVRAAVSCRPAGWNRAENYVLNWGKEWGREYRTTVAPLCASAGWRRCLIPLGIEVIRSSPPKLWKKYSEGFRPNFFRPVSRNRASPISRRTFAAADRKLSYPFGERSAAAHISRPGGEIYEEPRGIKEIKQSVYLHSLNPLPSASVRR